MLDARLTTVRVPSREIWCSTAQCGESLGTITASSLERHRGKPVWQIRPGWFFVHGILERTDYEFTSERKLLHEVIGQERAVFGVGYNREVDLDPPINVRCPKCRRVQMIVPANAFKRQEAPGRRF